MKTMFRCSLANRREIVLRRQMLGRSETALTVSVQIFQHFLVYSVADLLRDRSRICFRALESERLGAGSVGNGDGGSRGSLSRLVCRGINLGWCAGRSGRTWSTGSRSGRFGSADVERNSSRRRRSGSGGRRGFGPTDVERDSWGWRRGLCLRRSFYGGRRRLCGLLRLLREAKLTGDETECVSVKLAHSYRVYGAEDVRTMRSGTKWRGICRLSWRRVSGVDDGDKNFSRDVPVKFSVPCHLRPDQHSHSESGRRSLPLRVPVSSSSLIPPSICSFVAIHGRK